MIDKKVKSTRGIEKNMHDEIEKLVYKAYNEGYTDGNIKGINDCFTAYREMFRRSSEVLETETANTEFLFDVYKDPVQLVNSYLKDKEDKEDSVYKPRVGDVVIDPFGNECMVTNTDTCIHSVRLENGQVNICGKSDKLNLVKGKRAYLITTEEERELPW